MSTSTLTPDRQTFRETVALVAARAKEKLPEAVNGRIEHAVKLVLQHDVEPQDDGSILVGSSSDALKVYRLEGTTCTCQDFQYGKAPEGWCSHRIAAGIAKRVQELMPVEPPVEPWGDNDPEPEVPELGEAPAPAQKPGQPAQEAGHPALPEAAFSLTLKGTIDGQEALLTARGQTAAEFRANLAAIRGLLDAKPQAPAPAQPASPLSPQQHNAAAMHRPTTGFCKVHNVTMHWNEGKEGRKGWFGHRTADGQWCKGR
jgi:SWIM zinc finger